MKAKLPAYHGQPQDVVEVAVCLQSHDEPQPLSLHIGSELVLLHGIAHTRVDDSRLQRLLVPQQVCVLCERVELKLVLPHKAVNTTFLVLKYSSLK